MFGWLRCKPVLDEPSVQWLFDVYAWALRHLDAGVFYGHTQLIVPDGRFFPGQADSPQAMAELILGHVGRHAAMGHWPCRVLDYRQCPEQTPARVAIEGTPRRAGAAPPAEIATEERLLVQYDPAMLRNPEAQIASFAQVLAHYLAALATEPPPGGEENWPHTTEVVAIFLGFGLMFANSAFNVRIQRCGSCAPPPVDRQAVLSQYDTTYALAIFCALKGILASQVTPYLKASLRGYFRRALKDAKCREQFAALRAHAQA